MKFKKIFLKNVAITFAKVVGWITASVLFLVILVIILVQIPGIQNIIIDKVTQRLSEQLNTEVSIGNFRLAIPEFISLSEIYVEDQQKDTLFYTGNIRVDLDFSALLDQKIQVDRLAISNLVANLDRPENDSTFNYNFIVQSFSSDEPKTSPPDTTQGSNWSFGLDNIDLRDINFSMNDHYGGSIMSYEIGEFHAQLANMALDTMNFDINNIELNDSRGMIRITKFIPDTTESESTPFYLGLDQVKMRNIAFSFNNEVDSMSFNVEMGNFQATAENIDFPGQNFQLDNVLLEDTEANYQMFSPVDSTSADTTTEETSEEAPPWIFASNQFELDNINFTYNNSAVQAQPEGIDFNHLGIQNFDFAVDELYFSTDLVVNGEIERMNFSEKSGFTLEDLSTKLTFNNQEARLENLNIKTSNSDIQRTLIATYPDLNDITAQPGQVSIKVDLNDTEIGIRDVLYFVPDLRKSFNSALFDQSIMLNLNLEGTLADLMINQARLQALNSTQLTLEGNVRNLMEQENLFFDLLLDRFSTTPADMKLLLPAGTLPDSLTLPNRIYLSGNVNGHIDQFTSALDLNTSLGDLNARIAMSGLNQTPQYRANLTLDQLQVGTIIQNDSLIGPVSLTGSVSGRNFDLTKMQLDYDFKIPRITLLDYTYDSLGIEGNLENQLVNAHLAVLDSNLLMDLTGTVSLNPDNPVYKANLQLKGADLGALELTNEDISAEGNFVADFSGESLNDLQGELNVKNVNVIKDGKSYRLDSLIFISLNETGKTDLNIESDLLDATVKGNLEVADFVPVIKRHINKYYALQTVQPADADTLQAQDFTFSIDLKDPQFLTEVLVPGLDNYIPGEINGAFDSRKDSLAVNISIPQLTYTGLEVDTLVLNITSDEDMMYYVLSISQLAQGNINLENFGVSGLIYDDRIETRVQITDDERKEQYAFGGIFTSQEEDYRFVVEPPELILNYASWQVNPESYISLGNQLFINDLDISRDGQQIFLNTLVNNGDSTTQLKFDQFHLETISRMIESEESLFRGIMNGTAEFDSGPEGAAFNSELKIDDFSFKQDTLGLITLNAANNTEGILDLSLLIEGNGNDVEVAGTFDPTQEEAVVDMTADFNNLNLATIQGFVAGQFSTLEGSMEGELAVTGNVSQPAIDGSLNFTEATLALEMLGSKFNLDDESILFSSRGIELNEFQLTDKNGNNATIDGMIMTQNFQDFEFDLNFSSEDFLVMNTTKESDQAYYGTAIIDTDAQITGDLNTPQIQTNISLQEGSEINYALPDTEPVTVEQEGIVRFVDKDRNLNPILRDALAAEKDTTTMEIEGMDLTANIQIDDEVQVRIIIDEDAGDYLQVRGSSTLSLEIDPTGNINLTGRYQIQDGKYQLSFYQFVKREFLIEEGSSITWSGDPFNATLDITAINIVDTSPMEIMTNNASSMSRQEATQFSDIVPIAVRLNMEGELADPQISFALNVAEGEQGALASQVSNRLDQINEQENELNKQVFSLLVLQRFLPDNPFNAGGGGLSSTARSSVSKLLTQQLNRLSQNLEGVDLTFDVQSYEMGDAGGSSQARTDLEIGLSKSFFNDRVNVKVGSNIALEGPQASEQETMTDYVGDVQVQYKLTPDGRLLLEFFRSNVYEEMIEAELVETGLGLIFRRDYDKLREIFKETKEDKGFK